MKENRTSMWRVLSWAWLALLASCASTSLVPVNRSGNFVMEEDERRIWSRSKEEQEVLDRSGYIYEDSLLTDYVNAVVRQLRPPGSSHAMLVFQAKIIKNPLLNAFAYPNGVIYIHTGIISKMDNEAQLATVLGHEMSHAIYRHALASIHNLQNTTGVLSVLQIATLPFGIFGGLAGLLGNIGGLAAVTGYSRELESQADTSGLSLMVESGYDVREAPKVFVALKRDLDEQKTDEPFFFGSHPRLQDRIDNYTQLVTGKYSSALSTLGTERFDGLIKGLLLDNASLDLSMGRFRSVERSMGRVLRVDSLNARAYFMLGECYRLRSGRTNVDTAETHYRRAVACDSSFPPPHKAMGLILYKRGDKEAASEEFEEYLRWSPNADDRKYIEQYINEMKRR